MSNASPPDSGPAEPVSSGRNSAPSWYIPQPLSPHGVYDETTIRDIQRTLLVPETGVMDVATVDHIKGLQYAMGIPGSGRIDQQTAAAVQRLRDRFVISETDHS